MVSKELELNWSNVVQLVRSFYNHENLGYAKAASMLDKAVSVQYIHRDEVKKLVETERLKARHELLTKIKNGRIVEVNEWDEEPWCCQCAMTLESRTDDCPCITLTRDELTEVEQQLKESK